MKIISARERVHIEEYRLCFDSLSTPGAGAGFPCDKEGNVFLPLNEAAYGNYERCLRGEDVGPAYVRDLSRDYWQEAVKECDVCGEHAYQSRVCGAFVCSGCSNHEGLVRCFCGWSANGRWSGRKELVELGETLEAEEDLLPVDLLDYV